MGRVLTFPLFSCRLKESEPEIPIINQNEAIVRRGPLGRGRAVLRMVLRDVMRKRSLFPRLLAHWHYSYSTETEEGRVANAVPPGSTPSSLFRGSRPRPRFDAL